MGTYILLIDDDSEDIELMTETILSIDQSSSVISFLNPLEAIQYLTTASLLPTLVILDINMPQLNGEGCLKRIRAIQGFESVSIVMQSTALPELGMIEKYKELGAIFVQKPSTYQQLKLMLTKLLAQIQEVTK